MTLALHRYTTACATGTNLHHARPGSQWLGAFALAAKEQGTDGPLLAIRARYLNDVKAIPHARAWWAEQCARIAERRRWSSELGGKRRPLHTHASALATVAGRSFDHWLFNVCKACTGRRFITLHELMAQHCDAPTRDLEHVSREVLSDQPCPDCNGKGYMPVRHSVAWMAALIERAVYLLEERVQICAALAHVKHGQLN